MISFWQYIRKYYIACLLWALFFAMFYLLNDRKDLGFYLLVFVLTLAGGYNGYKKAHYRAQLLKSKGLSAEDEVNIVFVKKWDEIRTAGIWKYCLLDGGLITGAGIAFAVALLLPLVIGTQRAFAGPGAMFANMGYCYLAGITIGSILFRLIWPRNERRFKRLTQFPFGMTDHSLDKSEPSL